MRLLPMVLALLVASILSGTLVSRTGKYKIYPLVGSAVMTVGLYLLSRLGAHTGFRESALYMAVLGLGIGPLPPGVDRKPSRFRSLCTSCPRRFRNR